MTVILLHFKLIKIKELGIKKCRCNVFIPTKYDRNICECGRTEIFHRDVNNNSNYEQWNSINCTISDEITDAFGDLNFSEKNDLASKVTIF